MANANPPSPKGDAELLRATTEAFRAAFGPPPNSKNNGLPQKHIFRERILPAYENNRDRLREYEYQTSWWSKAWHSASEEEKEAGRIIFKLREHERENLFGSKASEAIPGPETRDMGGQFLTNRDRIAKSKIFAIAKQMPKGAHLHVHFNAELQVEELLERSYEVENMYIRSTIPLTSEQAFAEAEMVFSVKNPATTVEADLFSPNYDPTFKVPKGEPEPQPWVKWKRFCEEYKARRRTDQEGLEKWIKSKMVLSEGEVYGCKSTVNGIWARFNQGTRAFKGLMNYESTYRWYIRRAINNMIEERIMYCEMRPMLLDKTIPCDDGIKELDHNKQMEIIIEEYDKKREELIKNGELDKFPFGLKMVYCTPRSIQKNLMRKEVEDCLKLKIKYPDLICGFDLVGAEDRPNSIGYYHEELLAMKEACRQYNLDIPFLFHAGETLLDTGGSRYPDNSNLYDAVLLEAKRIGHGFALTKHPHLMEQFSKKKICIELCPISNELLHLCRNIKEHPYPQLLGAGIPCTVNSDNPTLYTNSLSHEFYQIMVGNPTMNIHCWKQLAEWSIDYSCLSDKDKATARAIFAKDWKNFCSWVIREYGDDARKTEIEAPF